MRAVERLLARLYARHGPAGLIPVIAVASVGSSAVAAESCVVVVARYGEVSLTDFVRFSVIAEVVMLVALALGVLARWRYVWIPLSWSRTSRSPEVAAHTWRTMMQVSRKLVTAVGATVVLLETGTVIWAVSTFGWHFANTFLIVALVAAMVAANCIFVMYWIDFAARPLIDDVQRRLPDDFQPDTPTLSLRAKALAPLPGAILFTALFVGAFSDTSAGVATRLLIGLGLAAVCAAIGLFQYMIVTRSALRPIDELQDATQRVGRGDLTRDVPLLTADELGMLGLSFNRMLDGLRQRESLRSAMGAYVDATIADRVVREGTMLQGEAVEATVMFVDIVGFTTLAEHALPEEVVGNLNEFFEVAIPAIEHHGGHTNKLLGDGLMAVFGIPTPLPDHADRALRAARAILAGVGERFGGRLEVGIGLNSGVVVAGSMGGGTKLDYTVIGDAVNVAARVEALTRETGDRILITEATRCGLDADPPDLVARGSTRVKGRRQEVDIFAIEAAVPAA